jgi:hypothetical protein
MILSFLALLELIRLKRIRIYQRGMIRAHPCLPAASARRSDAGGGKGASA